MRTDARKPADLFKWNLLAVIFLATTLVLASILTYEVLRPTAPSTSGPTFVTVFSGDLKSRGPLTSPGQVVTYVEITGSQLNLSGLPPMSQISPTVRIYLNITKGASCFTSPVISCTFELIWTPAASFGATTILDYYLASAVEMLEFPSSAGLGNLNLTATSSYQVNFTAALNLQYQS